MKVLTGDPASWVPPAAGTAVTIGVYDGVHRGHAHVIGRLIDTAGDLVPAVLTFDRHPLSSSAPDHAPRMLTRLDQKLEQLEALGVGLVGVLSFDDALRHLSAEEFAQTVLVDAMGARRIVVGRDFRFGYQRSGDVDMLVRYGADHGFEVEALELLGDGAPYASTVIRTLLEAGDVAAAGEMLGRPFELRGIVVHGDGRGALIGVPTANLDVDDGLAIPRRGVYAAEAQIGGETLAAVVNVGVRPTFGGGTEVVEVHLLDYSGDLYGRGMGVRFLDHLRDERRFSGVDELITQIHQDIEAARARSLEGLEPTP